MALTAYYSIRTDASRRPSFPFDDSARMTKRYLFTAVALTEFVYSVVALEVKEALEADEVRKETEKTVILYDS
jgi:BarA-like signal transduction histidine kinase